MLDGSTLETRARARRRTVFAALAAAVLITGIGTNAFGAPDKPARTESAPAAPAAPVVDAARAAASAQASAASPTSTHKPSTTSAPTDAGAAAGPVSTDPALRPVDLGSLAQPASVLAGIRDQAAAKGSARVIVTLRTTFQALGAQAGASAAQQQATVQGLSDTVTSTAVAHGGTINRTYGGNIPAVALTATPATLDALAASPAVAQISPDKENQPTLADSGPVDGASDAHDRGYGGAGTFVVVLDTGVDYNHPFFHGKVANAACFSGDSECPNGQATQFGGNAGIPCTYANDCDHGTHVAGIAAGAAEGTHQFDGVANQAKIEAIQITHSGSCTGGGVCATAYDSDIIAGLNQAYADRGLGTASVNLSFGGGKNTNTCDSAEATMKTAIDNLRSVNIATAIAAGNDSYTDAVSSPGCISTATTIGATDDSDVVAGFSNSAFMVDLYAPGVSIQSSVPGGSYGYKSGTSMATPQVAGAIAVMKSANSSLSVNSEESVLNSTGQQVTDSKSSLTRARINVIKAIGQETQTLFSDVLVDRRNPIPYDHKFKSTSTSTYWSAVAMRPPAGADYDLDVFDFSDYSSFLGISNAFGDTVEFVAQDGNRRAVDDTYPLVHKYTGTGRYQIEYANDTTTIGDGTSSISMTYPEIIEIRDTLMSAGVPTYFRVVPSNTTQDAEAFLMQSTAGTPSTYAVARSGSVASSSATGAGGEESFVYSSPAGQWDGFVLINRSGLGAYTVYRDTTGPTGSMVIEPGNPASVNKRGVVLQIAADDIQTGVRDMRVAADGVADTEPWVPYATTAPVTLSTGAGVKTVQVQVRDNANAISTFTDTVTLDTRANYKVTAVSNPPATSKRAATFSVTDTTKNAGLTASTVTSSNKYYLSTNTAYDAGTDVQLTGVRTVPALANGASNTGSRTLTVPATVVKGSYFLIACADTANTVNEFSDTDNCKASSAKVNVQVADYTVTAVSNPPATKARGTTFSATDTTKNSGTLAATASSKTRYYLSVDAVRDVSDKLLAPGRSVAALAAGATSAGSVTVTIPATGLSPGTYKLLACADDLANVDESSESNNCKAAANSINVT